MTALPHASARTSRRPPSPSWARAHPRTRPLTRGRQVVRAWSLAAARCLPTLHSPLPTDAPASAVRLSTPSPDLLLPPDDATAVSTLEVGGGGVCSGGLTITAAPAAAYTLRRALARRAGL